MKKVVSILFAMTVLCALFAGCATNTPDDNSPQNNSTSDTSPADNSTTTNDTKTYRIEQIVFCSNVQYSAAKVTPISHLNTKSASFCSLYERLI